MVMQKLRELIAEQFMMEESEITPETSFVGDLDADSLDIVELTMAIEEEFDVGEIDENDLKNIATVGDLAQYISDKVD